jgi:hypothetical protein
MAFEVVAVSGATADGILAWCGVTSPTPAETLIAEMAAAAAEDTIKFYRRTDTLEAEYASLAIEMGVYAYNKRGVDGVLAFSENGVSRSFEQGSFPTSMLSRIRLPIGAGPS